MDLVDENDVARLQRSQKPGKIARLGDDRTGSRLHPNAHRFSENVGKRGLAQSRRPRKENVVERFTSGLGGLDGEHQPVAHFVLADELIEIDRPEAVVEGAVAPVKFIALALGIHFARRWKSFSSSMVSARLFAPPVESLEARFIAAAHEASLSAYSGSVPFKSE